MIILFLQIVTEGFLHPKRIITGNSVNVMKLLGSLKAKAKKLKAEAQVLMLAYKDKRTPLVAKILIWVTVGYLLSPIDLIPDFIPVLGILDDLIIVPALITLS